MLNFLTDFFSARTNMDRARKKKKKKKKQTNSQQFGNSTQKFTYKFFLRVFDRWQLCIPFIDEFCKTLILPSQRNVNWKTWNEFQNTRPMNGSKKFWIIVSTIRDQIFLKKKKFFSKGLFFLFFSEKLYKFLIFFLHPTEESFCSPRSMISQLVSDEKNT